MQPDGLWSTERRRGPLGRGAGLKDAVQKSSTYPARKNPEGAGRGDDRSTSGWGDDLKLRGSMPSLGDALIERN